MAETQQMAGDGTWSWPCPYCGTSNALDAPGCVGCGAQLRDPAEDDLFTTVATHNAQMVDPNAPRIRESLWSTEAAPEEQVAEEVVEPPAPQQAPAPGNGSVPGFAPNPGLGTPSAAPQAPAAEPAAQAPPQGPFSAAAPSAPAREPEAPVSPFAASAAPPRAEPAAAAEPGPFAVSEDRSGAAMQSAPAADPFAGTRAAPPGEAQQPHHRATPDEHGLSVAVESLSPKDRERCDTPIAVCGALLGEQEVVLGVVAGHLLGHPAIVALTNTRVLVANARRWKPLVDQFIPDAEMMVHLRHDRDVASVTFVQGQRLTGVDDITDVTAAVDLVERIRAAAARRPPAPPAV